MKLDFSTSIHQQLQRQSWFTYLALILALGAGLAISRLPLPITAAALAGLAALLLIIRSPLFGLGLALLLGPLGALENIILGPMLLDSGQIALLLAIVSWLAGSLGRRRIWLPRLSFWLPWLAFVAVGAVSLLDAASLRLGLTELVKWVQIGAIVLVVVDLGTDGGRQTERIPIVARQVLVMLLLAGLVQAAVGIWQFGLRGTGPEHFAVLGDYYRAYGSFEQPNPYGGYMNLTALLALGLTWGVVSAFWARRGQPKSEEPARTILRPMRIWWLWAGLCAATASLAVLFSWSRGAWLGFLAGGAMLFLFSARDWRKSFLVGITGLLLGGTLLWAGARAGFGPAVAATDRLLGFREDLTFGDVRGVDINDTNYAVIERLAHWQAAIGMAEEDIWLGTGFGNYEAAYPRFALINWPAALGHAHNYYLNLLAETGILGLTAYLLFWGFVLWQTLRALRDLDWPDRGIALGLLAAWIALSVHHLVDKLYVNNVYIHLGVMLGLLQLLVGHGMLGENKPARGRIEGSAAS